MRISSGNNPYEIPLGEVGGGRLKSPANYRAWAAHERAAVQQSDILDFLACLWRLADEKEKATGNSGTLPSGIFAEHVRQLARKAGFATWRKGEGWLLTDQGRAKISGGKP